MFDLIQIYKLSTSAWSSFDQEQHKSHSVNNALLLMDHADVLSVVDQSHCTLELDTVRNTDHAVDIWRPQLEVRSEYQSRLVIKPL